MHSFRSTRTHTVFSRSWEHRGAKVHENEEDAASDERWRWNETKIIKCVFLIIFHSLRPPPPPPFSFPWGNSPWKKSEQWKRPQADFRKMSSTLRRGSEVDDFGAEFKKYFAWWWRFENDLFIHIHTIWDLIKEVDGHTEGDGQIQKHIQCQILPEVLWPPSFCHMFC